LPETSEVPALAGLPIPQLNKKKPQHGSQGNKKIGIEEGLVPFSDQASPSRPGPLSKEIVVGNTEEENDDFLFSSSDQNPADDDDDDVNFSLASRVPNYKDDDVIPNITKKMMQK
jgi:hypothetical protein